MARKTKEGAFHRLVHTFFAVTRFLVRFPENTAAGAKPDMEAMELQLVQSKTDIENPAVTLRATSVSL